MEGFERVAKSDLADGGTRHGVGQLRLKNNYLIELACSDVNGVDGRD
jgi:hypothetical protein